MLLCLWPGSPQLFNCFGARKEHNMDADRQCLYCDNVGTDDDGFCVDCLAREEADAALYAPHYAAYMEEREQEGAQPID